MITVGELMSSNLLTLRDDASVGRAQAEMKLGRIRHMPVLDGDRLVGVVSQRDLLAASLSKALDFEAKERRVFLKSVAVEEAMTRDPVTVSPGTTAGDAARLLVRRKIGCLPVVDAKGATVGLVTETDLLRSAYEVEDSESGAG